MTIEDNDRMIKILEIEIENIIKNNEADSYYILNHLRNSLAHGNIFFNNNLDVNCIADLEITFVDYESDTEIETFRGTIKFGQLLVILNDKKYMNSLFINDENPEFL